MREDHLIDAPPEYAHRLRAGALNIAMGGWLLALGVVLSMTELPSVRNAPVVRTAIMSGQFVLLSGALLLLAKGLWRISDTRIESIASRSVVVSSFLLRFALVGTAFACASWFALGITRGIQHDHDPTLAHVLARTNPPMLPVIVGILSAGTFIAWQHGAVALRDRTSPQRPGVVFLPFTLATLPVGLVTLPGATHQPTVIAFVTMTVAIACAFVGSQGAVLRHRIARVLRERRRAEVLVSREP